MLDVLAKINEGGGGLIGVAYTLFDGDTQFVTGVGLRFESACATFRADADDDTLSANLEPLLPNPDETLIDVGNSAPWSDCSGLGVSWAWQLTNQQGYSDGVRLEFSEPGQAFRTVLEMVVSASAIQVYVAQHCN